MSMSDPTDKKSHTTNHGITHLKKMAEFNGLNTNSSDILVAKEVKVVEAPSASRKSHPMNRGIIKLKDLAQLKLETINTSEIKDHEAL